MPYFAFTAVDDQGRRVRGRYAAADEASLARVLRSEGRWLASAEPCAAPRATSPRRVGGAPVSRRVLIQFFLSIGLQLKAGTDTCTALSFGLESNSDRGFGAVHADLVQRVRAGSAFSAALAAHPRVFSPLVVNLVRAGEASGRLVDACADIRAHYEWTERLAGEVRQALLYPAAVLVAVLMFLVLVFAFFIPRFVPVLRELNVPLPALTEGMIFLSGFLRAHGVPTAAAALAAGAAGVWAFSRSPRVRRTVDAGKLRIPIVGPILLQISLSRFVGNLASLYRAGIPLLEALRLCAPLVGNRAIEEAIRRMEEGVRAGQAVHSVMNRLGLFPPLVVQMMALGENTGALDESLQSVADYYHAAVPQAVRRLFVTLEPMMVLGLVAMVGTVALSVVLPIASALEAR